MNAGRKGEDLTFSVAEAVDLENPFYFHHICGFDGQPQAAVMLHVTESYVTLGFSGDRGK